MLSYFLEPKIISRANLLVIDGAITEYVPFITNTDSDNPFFNSYHGLCYYHLTAQGFQRNASPYIPEVNRNDLSCLEYIKIFRYWVKSCFFPIETEIEYNYSRNFLLKWVDSLRMELSPNYVNQMSNWIKIKLVPFQILCLNHKKLFIKSFNCS